VAANVVSVAAKMAESRRRKRRSVMTAHRRKSIRRNDSWLRRWQPAVSEWRNGGIDDGISNQWPSGLKSHPSILYSAIEMAASAAAE